MSQDDAVAFAYDKDGARLLLAGRECFDPSTLVRFEQADEDDDDVVMLILKQDAVDQRDGQAVAEAVVLALGILPRTMIIDADATIPEGFVHRHFVEVGQDPTRTTRGQRVDEVIPPVTFCEDASERT